jgi:hypothetical protein
MWVCVCVTELEPVALRLYTVLSLIHNLLVCFNIHSIDLILCSFQEKLKSRMYTTLEEFEADFTLMFSNIFLYFPETSAQYLKAKELQILFRDRWTHVLLDLKKI